MTGIAVRKPDKRAAGHKELKILDVRHSTKRCVNTNSNAFID